MKTITIKFFSFLCVLLIANYSSNAQLRVTGSNGNVGIGLDNPTDKLEVDGNVFFRDERLAIGHKTVPQNTFIDLYNGLPGNGAFTTGGRFIANDKGNVSFMAGSTGDFSLRTWNPTSGINFVTNDAVRFSVSDQGEIFMGQHETNPNNTDMVLTVNGDAQKTGSSNWSVISDARLKTNINNYTTGLDAIMKINPVTYNYNGDGGVADTEKTHVGLLAQEFQKVAPDAIGTYKHKSSIKSTKTMDEFMKKGEINLSERAVLAEYLTVDNSSIVYMLINGMKEQQKQIEELKTELAEVKTTQVNSNSINDGTTNVLLTGNQSQVVLGQNQPNPFNTQTTIEYFLPKTTRAANLVMYDMQGRKLKTVALNTYGQKAAVNLKVEDVAAGTYSYALEVDGKVHDAKKMVLLK